MNQELQGTVALVTGAARGIGAATAAALAEAGAAVVLTDVLDEEGGALAASLRAAGFNAHYEHLDVSDEGNWGRIVDGVVADLGRLDVLVSNAGIGTLLDVEVLKRARAGTG